MTEENNMNVDNEESSVSDISKLIGKVNWFNRKKGYGFITCVTPENKLINEDIFFHYSSIKTDNFKTLYPGEYVSFILGTNDKDGKTKNICLDITGVYGGPLLTDNTTHTIRVIEKRTNTNQ
jgi:CspA family cold shock protein